MTRRKLAILCCEFNTRGLKRGSILGEYLDILIMAIKGVAVELGKKHSIRQKFKVPLRLHKTRKRHALPKRNSSATIQLNIDYRNIDCIALNQVLSFFFLRINSCLQMPNTGLIHRTRVSIISLIMATRLMPQVPSGAYRCQAVEWSCRHRPASKFGGEGASKPAWYQGHLLCPLMDISFPKKYFSLQE